MIDIKTIEEQLIELRSMIKDRYFISEQLAAINDIIDDVHTMILSVEHNKAERR